MREPKRPNESVERRPPAGIEDRRRPRRQEAVCVFLLFCLLTTAGLWADTTFTASVDRSQVALGDYFEITFTLSGSTGGGNFHPPDFSNFDVASGPNQSTSMQIINGAVSSSVSYSYALQPRAEGKFTIGPAWIEAGGKRLQTQAVTIEAVKGSAQPARPGGSTQALDARGQLAGNVLLKATVDNARVYQGEQITVSYKVYTRVQIQNYNVTKAPAWTGFWSEDLPMPKQIEMSTETIDGKQYAVGVLRKVALFPQRSGTLDLDPMQIEVTVPMRRQSSDFFDQFFNSTQPVNYKTASEPVRVTVLPLPSENVPAGFRGAVGKFQMEAQVDKQQVRANDPLILKVKISGRGNLKLLEAPELSIPPDVEHFEPKISNSIAPEGTLIAGSRTFEYLLIPRHAGNQEIPPFSFSYFDTDQKRFVSLRSPGFVIKVDRGAEGEGSPASGVGREDIRLLGEDIRFIKSGNVTFRRKGESFTGSALFYALVLSPPFVFVLFLVMLKRREKALSDVFALRSRKARKAAQQRLAKAKKLLQEKKQEEFYAEVSRALWGYLSDRFGIPIAEMNRDRVQSELHTRSVTPETVAGILSTMDRCEFARFAPGADATLGEQVLHGAVDLITNIEDQLR